MVISFAFLNSLMSEVMITSPGLQVVFYLYKIEIGHADVNGPTFCFSIM